MNLIRDPANYRDAIRAFVERQIGADQFVLRFEHLWQCDRADGISDDVASIVTTPAGSALYGVLDAINHLCETYVRCLSPGCGYRVSEDQFRREIQCMASAIPMLTAPRANPSGFA